ncbi:MAG: T9SS type A sorting domain-containing protein [Bacteroidales bacterium]|nr:T9SS type A sorting domain-containing protein [Bacteroidales bacterium]
MKKLLLSTVCALIIFGLNAQVTENFSDYTVGGKLAQQAQGMGRNYWTTWSNAPGGAEDGVIADVSGNKVGSLTYGNDQVLLLGGKTSGVWEFTMKMFVPASKCGYFNILADFAGTSSTWATQVYFNKDGTAPGVGAIDAGAESATTFTFNHDEWVNIKLIIDLDTDNTEFYINDGLVYEWQYTLGSFGDGCPRIIDAMNIYPPTAGMSDFYIDDIVFTPVANAIFETNFDELSAGAYVAQSYPDWWRTWSNLPGTSEDGLITVEQASSTPNSAKISWGADLIFMTGDKTTGSFTIDFDMYIPGTAPAYFNLLHNFNGTNSEWAIGIHFNITDDTNMPALGTYVQQDGNITNFTAVSDAWFPVSFVVDLDNDLATLDINGTQILEWQFSLIEDGGAGLRQLGAVDFYPPETGSVFYIDNFVFGGVGGGAPSLAVTPNSISEETLEGSGETFITPVNINNTGTSIGDYVSWASFIDEGKSGEKASFTLTYCNSNEPVNLYYNQATEPPVMEFAAKYPLSVYCDMVGTYITKVSFFLPNPTSDNKLTARVYGQGAAYNSPGEVLTEITINNPIVNYWNELTLPEPVLLSGQDIWVAFEGTQPVGESGLMATDGGPAVENGDWRRTNGGSWGQLHVIQPDLGNGNFMIRAYAEGDVIPGCWLSLEGDTYGSISAGNSATFDIILDSEGLEVGTYEATVSIATNDVNNELFEIPCTLKINELGVEEFAVNNVTTKIYPNPTSDMVTIESNKDINSIQIVNNVGQIVYSAKVNSTQTTINTSGFNTGMYFVRISTDAGSITTKLIVR